ncbi:MAG: DUF3501 family protein [Acidimicrobiales bacterium]
MANSSPRRLVLADIEDHRHYERHREEFKHQVIELKRRRRVGLGPVVSLLFESWDTILFQVQEMARAERILSDDGIQAELDIYNPLIPQKGQLSATLFVELTSTDEMQKWLPLLVGIERSIDVVIRPEGEVETRVRCRPEAAHASALTRPDVTASVHYVSWQFEPGQVDAFGAFPVSIESVHDHYAHGVELASPTRLELLSDLV